MLQNATYALAMNDKNGFGKIPTPTQPRAGLLAPQMAWDPLKGHPH